MKKLFFLGGEDLAKRDSKEINKRAFVEAGGAPAVLTFNWTSESVDKMDRYGKMIVDYFEALGACTMEFAGYSDSLEEIARKVERSDLIYLPGGITRILVERIMNAKVDNLLREYDRVIVGNSAGALALCTDCILMKGKDNRETAVISGLGLVDFSVVVHYDPSEDEELRKLSSERKIYGIPEGCALVYDNGILSFIGNVYLFYKGKKKSVN